MNTHGRAIRGALMSAATALALVGPGLVRAAVPAKQPPATEAASAAPADEQPEVVPQSEILTRSETTTERLADLVQVAEPLDEVSETKSSLEAAAKRLLELDDDLKQLTALAGSTAGLESQRQRGLALQKQLDQWGEALASRAEQLQTARGEVLNQRQLWQQTQQSLKEEDAPRALQQRTSEVLEAIADADARFMAALDRVLTLQKTTSEERLALKGQMERLEAAQAARERALLRRDSEPLWSVLVDSGATADVRTDLEASWGGAVQALRAFAASNRERIEAQALFLALMIVLLVALSRVRPKPEEDDHELRESLAVLRRPISVALVTVFVWTKEFYPDAPEVLLHLNRLLLLLPLLRLVWPMLKPWRRRPVGLLAVLYALQAVLVFLPKGTLLERLFLLLVSLLSLAGCLWWLISRAGDQYIDRASRPLRWVLRAALVPFAVAAVANLTGRVALADELTLAALECLFVLVACWALYLLFNALVRVVLKLKPATSLRSVREAGDVIARRLGFLAGCGLLVLGTQFILDRVGVYDPLSDAALALVGREYAVGSLRLSLAGVLAFVGIVWLSFAISRALRFFLERDVLSRLPLPRGVPGALSMLTHYVVLVLGCTVALAALGADLGKLSLLAGALGIGLGFGLQNIVSNFVSGLILIAERPIQVGDTIEVGAVKGSVKHIGVRASTVKTFEGAEVLVPNGLLISKELTNWTLTDRSRRVEVPVRVAYGSDPRRIIELLVGVAAEHSEIRSQPPPFALLNELGESALHFVVRFWPRESADWVQVRNDVAIGVYRALQAAGVVIPYPQLTVHTSQGRRVEPPAAPAGAADDGDG
jgi:small-conductance mechanosensitive channel